MELLLNSWFCNSYHNWWAICTNCDLITGTTAIAENAAGVAILQLLFLQRQLKLLLVSLEYTGTATNGTDYVASSMTISIPAGDLTGTVTIDPTADPYLQKETKRLLLQLHL
jgi:hypothetical protein